MQWAIELDGVSRSFGRGDAAVSALTDVTLAIEEGGITALLGENGAGKTTLTKILATLLFPSSGSARVFGKDTVRDESTVRSLTTAIFGGDRGLYPMLSGRENLRYFGAINGVSGRALRQRADELLEETGLLQAAGRKVETYSKGMRQRLHICIGLLTQPRLLLLDEPTVGLDPQESARLREVIAGFPAAGTTVLLTSHNLTDVDELASRVVMLSRGSVTHDLPIADFRRLSGAEAVVTVALARAGVLPDSLAAMGATMSDDATRIMVPITQWSASVLGSISAALTEHDIDGMSVRTSSLEEAYAAASRSE